jgi:hypothetical protein
MRNYKSCAGIHEDCSGSGRRTCHRGQRFLLMAFGFGLWLTMAGSIQAQTNLSEHGGPIMQTVDANLIFWLPPGSHYVSPPAGNAAADQLYENTITNFLNDLGQTGYWNILTQYPGQCSSTACTAPQNSAGAIRVGRVFQDFTPYPQSPLQDSDVQNEIQNFINQNGLSFGLNTEFFVFTGAAVQECNGLLGCTSTDFCAYHSEFDFNGGKVIYAFMPNADSLPGCSASISSGPNQLSADRETSFVSHELYESVTDPLPFGTSLNIFDPLGNTAWWDSSNIFSSSFGQEIGDKCNQVPSSVNLNGKAFIAQQQWSNDTSNCVASFGPSIEFDVSTGSDDLRGDSSATAGLQSGGSTFQTVSLKSQGQSSWGNDTTNEVVTGLRPPALPTAQTPLTDIAVTLTSHNSFGETGDNWNIEHLTAKVLDPTGRLVCELSLGGDPLVRLTGSMPIDTFLMPNCPNQPPPPNALKQIEFVIVTGSDDLRGDSSATATIKAPNGSVLQVITLKAQNQSGWNNNSTHDLIFALNPPQPLSQLQNILITLTSHDSFGETDDNWNIQSVNITAFDPQPAQCLINSGGNPLARLTNNAPTLTLSTPNCTPTPPPTAKFNQVEFNITTGGDDLRGDSSATAVLLLNSAPVLFTLKAQSDPSWDNNTNHDKTFSLNTLQPLSAFGNAVITLTSHNGFGESNDNWNIQSILVKLSDSGNNPTCFFNAAGNPFSRLTGSAPSVTLTPRAGCP